MHANRGLRRFNKRLAEIRFENVIEYEPIASYIILNEWQRRPAVLHFFNERGNVSHLDCNYH